MKLLICILLLPLTASAQRLYIGDTIVWKPDTLLFVQAVHATVTVRYLPNDRGWVTLIVRTGSGEFVRSYVRAFYEGAEICAIGIEGTQYGRPVLNYMIRPCSVLYSFSKILLRDTGWDLREHYPALELEKL